MNGKFVKNVLVFTISPTGDRERGLIIHDRGERAGRADFREDCDLWDRLNAEPRDTDSREHSHKK